METSSSPKLEINLAGLIQSLPRITEGLQPLFEAVANSIHAIQERGQKDGVIEIEIVRTPETGKLFANDDTANGVYGFIITDNGSGFDDRNLASFKTAHSEHKMEKGGKGVGRFIWLRAFDSVHIDSIYEGNRDASEDEQYRPVCARPRCQVDQLNQTLRQHQPRRRRKSIYLRSIR